MNCPQCKTPLRVDHYEQIEIDRCDTCNGLWLDDREMMSIIRKRDAKFSPSVLTDVLSQSQAGLKPQPGQAARVCPKCAEPLKHVNHSYSSGIILDSCAKGHGVWLDQDELEKVQAFEEHWDVEAKRRLPEIQGKLDSAKTSGDREAAPAGILGPIFNFLVSSRRK
ncbi:MAG: zf-TFIIB domain-containing protein [Bdellovibrionales bacterium]|nr:zf-TFIIB domain-containing protein [Bdellovibrionales bacterium]